MTYINCCDSVCWKITYLENRHVLASLFMESVAKAVTLSLVFNYLSHCLKVTTRAVIVTVSINVGS